MRRTRTREPFPLLARPGGGVVASASKLSAQRGVSIPVLAASRREALEMIRFEFGPPDRDAIEGYRIYVSDRGKESWPECRVQAEERIEDDDTAVDAEPAVGPGC